MPASIDLDDALKHLLADLSPLREYERVNLDQALGRVPARPPCATTAVPPFTNSAMDGYAVSSTDPRHQTDKLFSIVETIFAGQMPRHSLDHGECARIFTGAPLPQGADAVVAQENAEPIGEQVRFLEHPTAGHFVRMAGSDVTAGQQLLPAGTRLHAGHIALLAAAGLATIEVIRRPRVAIIISGDELRDPPDKLARGQIYDSARFALPALAATLPVTLTPTVRVGDSLSALTAAFMAASHEADVLLTTGGVSVGDADHVREALAQGGQIDFWRLAIKPGRPFAYGRFRDRPFFGLPGNPVSSLVTFLLLVRPALLTLAGIHDYLPPRLSVCLAAPVHKTPGRRDFQRARLEADGSARAFTHQDSHLLSCFAKTDVLLDLPRDAGDQRTGAQVSAIDLRGLLGPR